MFNIYLAVFIVSALFVTGGGAYKLVGLQQTIGAILFFIGASIVFIVYGIRWFGSSISIFSETPVNWPPTINTCPDYLVYYNRKMADGSSQDSCIDTLGVSKNGSLKVFVKGEEPPSSDEYYFPLTTKSSDASAKNAELCQRAITYGLTWEGITNGESCITSGGQVAPSSGGSSGSGSNGCPAQ
jgi:hypothetical protein